METEINLNYNLYKEGYKNYQKIIRNIFIKLLCEIPKEEIYDILKQKKFIERDWNAKGVKYLTKPKKVHQGAPNGF